MAKLDLDEECRNNIDINNALSNGGFCVNKKGIRIAVALILTLGLILSTVSVAYAKGKPVITAEVINLNISGNSLHFNLHLVNLTKAAFYKCSIANNDTPTGYDDATPLPNRLPKDFTSEEITRAIGTPSGHYDITVQLYDRNMKLLLETLPGTVDVPTITFSETNNVAGVSIQVYSDSGLTVPVGSALTTNASGNATIDLQNGTYYYKATKTGYDDLTGDFIVSSSDLTESFTMVLSVYTVTFDETNDVSGVEIYIFADPEYTNYVDLVVTDEYGNATKNLQDGTYYYGGLKVGYLTFLGDFTVSGEPLTESFTMIPTYTVTFSETNGVSDVWIDVYSDPDLTDPIDFLWTDASGNATTDLQNGIYYYEAYKINYDDLTGDFTVSDEPLTESFTMVLSVPSAYTVTFDETNDVPSVYIYIYTDPDYTNYVGVVLTDSSGQATKYLQNGAYYYKATRTGYDDLTGDFTVSGSDSTESFTMVALIVYTVTFNETNYVSDVYIYIWADPAREGSYLDLIVTDESGNATIDLQDGTYYWTAIRTGYLYSYGDFTVSGEPLTESFAMTPVYTVTFSETNEVSDVEIPVYTDSARTDLIAVLYTNASGNATIDLENGTYYYKAIMDPYGDLYDTFTVSGAPLTESFTMMPIVFAEDFTGIDPPELPAEWTTTSSEVCFTVDDFMAGGVPPELQLKYSGDSVSWNDNRVSTPAIDATATTSTLNLSFKHYFELYDDVAPYYYAVEISNDGGTTWTATSCADSPNFTKYPSGYFGPITVNINLDDYVGDTIMISWHLYGYTYHMDYWDVDDIILTGF